MKFNLKQFILPTSEMIINSKHRFNLFGPTISGTKGLLLKTLRALNKVRDISVLDYDLWSNYVDDDNAYNDSSLATAAVYLLVKEEHEIYKNINILSPLGRDVDYMYSPIKIKLDNDKVKSVAIRIEFITNNDDDIAVRALEQIINILGERK